MHYSVKMEQLRALLFSLNNLTLVQLAIPALITNKAEMLIAQKG